MSKEQMKRCNKLSYKMTVFQPVYQEILRQEPSILEDRLLSDPAECYLVKAPGNTFYLSFSKAFAFAKWDWDNAC